MTDKATMAAMLHDVVFNLRNRAEDAARNQNDDFEKGRALAYAEVLDHIIGMANTFDVSRQSIGLEDYDPLSEL